MSPWCLLRQFVDHCLLSWALFVEKTVRLCFTRFLFKWRETVLWMFPDATQAGTSCTFEYFRDNGDQRESWFRLVEISEGDGNNDWRLAGRGNWWRGRLVGKIDHTARRIAVNEDLDVPTRSERPSSSRDRRYEYTTIVASETLRISCQEKQERCVKTLVK